MYKHKTMYNKIVFRKGPLPHPRISSTYVMAVSRIPHPNFVCIPFAMDTFRTVQGQSVRNALIPSFLGTIRS